MKEEVSVDQQKVQTRCQGKEIQIPYLHKGFQARPIHWMLMFKFLDAIRMRPSFFSGHMPAQILINPEIYKKKDSSVKIELLEKLWRHLLGRHSVWRSWIHDEPTLSLERHGLTIYLETLSDEDKTLLHVEDSNSAFRVQCSDFYPQLNLYVLMTHDHLTSSFGSLCDGGSQGIYVIFIEDLKKIAPH